MLFNNVVFALKLQFYLIALLCKFNTKFSKHLFLYERKNKIGNL